MGCCSSKGSDSKVSRTARWRSTGIVALRDSKLKVRISGTTFLIICIQIVKFTCGFVIWLKNDHRIKLTLGERGLCRIWKHRNLFLFNYEKQQQVKIMCGFGFLAGFLVCGCWNLFFQVLYKVMFLGKLCICSAFGPNAFHKIRFKCFSLPGVHAVLEVSFDNR